MFCPSLILHGDKASICGAHGEFSGDRCTGTFSFGTAIRSGAMARALGGVLSELDNCDRGGPTAEELVFTRSAIVQFNALRYETPIQKAGFIMRIVEHHPPADDFDRQIRILAKMEQLEIEALAGRWLRTNAAKILLVAAESNLYQDLPEPGPEIIELNSNGGKATPTQPKPPGGI